MAKRKQKHGEEEENLERWLITYADMITLLMAFFIMMYAMSVVNMGKFAQLAISVRTGFGGPVPGALPDVLGLHTQQINDTAGLAASEFELVNMADQFIVKQLGEGGPKSTGQSQAPKEKLSDQIEVVKRGQDLVIRLKAGPIIFPRGSAELTAAARRILDAVAKFLAFVPNRIRIEGHTCDLPIHTALYPSNWELSAHRATNVMVYLIRRGIDPSRICAAGFADTRPLVPNIDEAHRRKNRRVEIVLVGALNKDTIDLIKRKFGIKPTSSNEKLNPNVRPDLAREAIPEISHTPAD